MQDRRKGAREETKKKRSRQYRSRNKLEERPGGQKGKEGTKTSEGRKEARQKRYGRRQVRKVKRSRAAGRIGRRRKGRRPGN